MKHATWFVVFMAATAFALQGFGGATRDPQRVFRLDGGDVTYAVGINNSGQLQMVYWGKRLPALQSAAPKSGQSHSSFENVLEHDPQEFTGSGVEFYVEPDLKITFPAGNRDLVLKYSSDTTSFAIHRIYS
jgi:alpha-galactosidase